MSAGTVGSLRSEGRPTQVIVDCLRDGPFSGMCNAAVVVGEWDAPFWQRVRAYPADHEPVEQAVGFLRGGRLAVAAAEALSMKGLDGKDLRGRSFREKLAGLGVRVDGALQPEDILVRPFAAEFFKNQQDDAFEWRLLEESCRPMQDPNGLNAGHSFALQVSHPDWGGQSVVSRYQVVQFLSLASDRVATAGRMLDIQAPETAGKAFGNAVKRRYEPLLCDRLETATHAVMQAFSLLLEHMFATMRAWGHGNFTLTQVHTHRVNLTSVPYSEFLEDARDKITSAKTLLNYLKESNEDLFDAVIADKVRRERDDLVKQEKAVQAMNKRWRGALDRLQAKDSDTKKGYGKEVAPAPLSAEFAMGDLKYPASSLFSDRKTAILNVARFIRILEQCQEQLKAVMATPVSGTTALNGIIKAINDLAAVHQAYLGAIQAEYDGVGSQRDEPADMAYLRAEAQRNSSRIKRFLQENYSGFHAYTFSVDCTLKNTTCINGLVCYDPQKLKEDAQATARFRGEADAEDRGRLSFEHGRTVEHEREAIRLFSQFNDLLSQESEEDQRCHTAASVVSKVLVNRIVVNSMH